MAGPVVAVRNDDDIEVFIRKTLRQLPQLRSREHNSAMQEVLSSPGESEKSVNEQEYWVLEILDRTGSWQPGFAVQQSRGFWSEIDKQFMFDEIETETCPTPQNAEERYEARRLALVQKGFIHSDMDF